MEIYEEPDHQLFSKTKNDICPLRAMLHIIHYPTLAVRYQLMISSPFKLSSIPFPTSLLEQWEA